MVGGDRTKCDKCGKIIESGNIRGNSILIDPVISPLSRSRSRRTSQTGQKSFGGNSMSLAAAPPAADYIGILSLSSTVVARVFLLNNAG